MIAALLWRIYVLTWKRRRAVTPLSSRTFGVWTFLSGVLRMYTAYDITNKRWVSKLHMLRTLAERRLLHALSLYDLSLISYILVVLHFTSELLIFRTAKMQRGVLAPLIVGSE